MGRPGPPAGPHRGALRVVLVALLAVAGSTIDKRPRRGNDGDDGTWWSEWIETTHMPMAVYDCHAIDSNGMFYVLGGHADAPGGDSDRIVSLDPSTMSWSDQHYLPLSVRGRSTVAHGDFIYVFSDAATAAATQQGDSEIPRVARLNTTDLDHTDYNTTYEWEVLPSHNIPVPPTCGAAAVVFGNLIYLIGGSYIPPDELESGWGSVDGDETHYPASYSCDQYIFGAQEHTSTPTPPLNITASVRSFNPATGEWKDEEPLPVPLFYPTAVVADKLYVIGGMESNGVWTNTVFVKSWHSTVWEVYPSMPAFVSARNRYLTAPAAYAFDSYIWVLGHEYVPSPSEAVMVQGLVLDLYLRQWTWTSIDGLSSKGARQRGCYGTGTGPAKGNLFLYGGIDAAGEPTNKASLVQASIYPYITNTKESYVVGESIAITVSQVSPRNPFTFRLSSTPLCWDSALGSRDQLWSGEQNEIVFETKSVGKAYLCLSIGACPGSPTPRTNCYSQSSPVPDMPSCLSMGCCYERDKRGRAQCFQRLPQSPMLHLTRLTPLNWGSPIYVLPNAETEIPATGSPPTLAPPSRVTLSVTDMLWLGVGIVLFLICCGGFYFYAMYKFGSSPRPRGYDTLAGSNVERYTIMHKLGSGGYGYVFLVRRRTDGCLMAMKYISVANDTERHDAVAEFELTKSLQGHPNIVVLLDMFMSWSSDGSEASSGGSLGGRVRGHPPDIAALSDASLNIDRRYVCIVMEYYPAGDLKEFLLGYGASLIPEATLWYITHQVCLALSFMHGRSPPVVHRDLKPENILIHSTDTVGHTDADADAPGPNGVEAASEATATDTDGVPPVLLPNCVVTDLGLAKVFSADGYCQTQAGSLPYVAPECWQRRYGVGVDMWALGCILYAACTGRIDSTQTKVMFSEVNKESFREDLQAEVVANYSQTLSDFILLLLEPDPHVRPSAQYCEEYSRTQLSRLGITDVKPEAVIEQEIAARSSSSGGTPAPIRRPSVAKHAPCRRRARGPHEQGSLSSTQGSHPPSSTQSRQEDSYLLSNAASQSQSQSYTSPPVTEGTPSPV